MSVSEGRRTPESCCSVHTSPGPDAHRWPIERWHLHGIIPKDQTSGPRGPLLLRLLLFNSRRGRCALWSRRQFESTRLYEVSAKRVKAKCRPVKVRSSTKVLLSPPALIVEEREGLRLVEQPLVAEMLLALKLLFLILLMLLVVKLLLVVVLQKWIRTLAGRAPWVAVA